MNGFFRKLPALKKQDKTEGDFEESDEHAASGHYFAGDRLTQPGGVSPPSLLKVRFKALSF